MIEAVGPYRQYRDSGIPWVQRAPAHWVIARLKHVSACLDGKRVPLNSVERGIRRGPIPYWGANAVVDHIDSWLFDETLVLLGEDGAPFFDKSKSVAFCVSGRCWVNNHIHVLRPRLIDAAFLTHYLNTVDYAEFVDGSTRDKLTQGKMNEIPVVLPPPEEQRAVVRFLDYADRRIRKYIAAKRKLIALLEEQKRAIIDRAVTRGLDPNVRLKDSGVPWIGMVPEHWGISRLGHLFAERVTRGSDGYPLLTVSIKGGVGVAREVDDGGKPKRMIAQVEGYKFVGRGDIAYNTMRMWQGAVGTAPCDGLVSPAYVVACPLRDNFSQYFELLFRTQRFQAEVNQVSRGIVSDRNRLYWDSFKQIQVATPPAHEQRQLADSLAVRLAGLTGCASALEREISLLREYRTRLISDVVTGKLDVREAAARLPEETEEPLETDEAEAEDSDEGDEEAGEA